MGKNLQKGNEGKHGKKIEPPLPHVMDQSEEQKEEDNQSSAASNNVHHGLNGKGAEYSISCNAPTKVARPRSDFMPPG